MVDNFVEAGRESSFRSSLKKKKNSTGSRTEVPTCDICDKVFTSKGTMSRHRLLHFDRPYPCPLCNKGFVERNKLKKHLISQHKGEDLGDIDQVFKLEGNHKRYTCENCNIGFTLYDAFKSHICLGQLEFSHYRCELCDEDFRNKDFLKDHIETWHTDESKLELKSDEVDCKSSLSADEDGSSFSNQRSPKLVSINNPIRIKPSTFQMKASKRKKLAIKHLKVVAKDGDSKPMCSICLKTFHSISVFYNHVKSHEVSMELSCKQCKKTFRTKTNLRMHMSMVHNLTLDGKIIPSFQTSQQCPVCHKMLSDVAGLARHMKKHTGEGHPCEECGKFFTEAAKLKGHIQAVHQGIRYKCHLCDNKYSNYSTLKKHLIQHEKGEVSTSRIRQNLDAPHNRHCQICDRMFPTRKQFVEHRRKKHEDQKRHICEHCGKSFLRLRVLKHHLDFVHKGVKHKCHLCEKEYFQRDYLDKHLRQHATNTLPQRKRIVRPTAEPYCEICDKKFTQWGGLQRHMKKHNGLAHPCEFCGKRYTEKIKLKNHISSVHFQVRWKCTKCDKAYTTERYLQEHMADHDELFQYFCRLCGRGFASKGRCTQHEKRHKQSDWRGVDENADVIIQYQERELQSDDKKAIPAHEIAIASTDTVTSYPPGNATGTVFTIANAVPETSPLGGDVASTTYVITSDQEIYHEAIVTVSDSSSAVAPDQHTQILSFKQ